MLLDEQQWEAGKQVAMRVVPAKELADAELTLVVNLYGLGQTQGLSSQLYPLINVTGTITRKDAALVWQKSRAFAGEL